MKTRILSILLAILMVVSVFALAACDMGGVEGPEGPQGEQGEPGEDGKDGIDGTDGKDGVGIEKIEVNADGDLVITLTNGTTQTVAMPKDEHVHTFGDWRNHNTLSSCEDQLYYRICSGCSDIGWRAGTYEDHDFETVTTPPTCQAGGFDTKTCENCGKVEICNETPISDHNYDTEYTTDNSFHWNVCTNCSATTTKVEHTLGDDGFCTVCEAQIGDTVGIIYEISANGTYAEVIGYSGTATRIKIADTYMGLPVKVIYEEAFYNNKTITSVIIPDSVEFIRSNAFYDCYSLTSVVIGDSVEFIGNGAFAYCDSLTSVVIPDSVTSIGLQAFYGCNSSLYTEYEYGKYLKSGDNTYAVLIELTNKNFGTYTIHEDTKIIAYGVFSGCERLTSITIPDSVTYIGYYAFSNCDRLTAVYITDLASWCNIAFSGSTSNPLYYAENLYLNGELVTELVIPDDVTQIKSDAFFSCDSLVSVVIPDSVTSIGYEAFYNCDSLESVVIGDSVTFIASYAFSYCFNLTNVYYNGTEEDWEEIWIASDNDDLENATRYYYSEEEPTEEGNFWHWGENGEVVVWGRN